MIISYETRLRQELQRSATIFFALRRNCLAIKCCFKRSSGKKLAATGMIHIQKRRKRMEIDWAYLRKG
jgi:hypothetical protein